MAGVVFHQVIIMTLLVIVGMVMTRVGLITEKATRVFCNLLLTVVVPCSIIKAYAQPFLAERMPQLGLSFLLAIAFHCLAVAVSRILVRKRETAAERMHCLAIIYANCGFMGFPLMAAVGGEEATFLGSAFVAVFNIFVWTEGIVTLTGKKIGIKKVFLNPGCIAVSIGLFIYFMQVSLPAPIIDTVEYLARMNTPLAMVAVGVFLSQVPFGKLLKDGRVIFISLVKTIFIPVAFVVLLWALGVPNWFEGAREVCIAITICASCPVAGTAILVPAAFGLDGSEGVKLLAVSTVISIITLPLMGYIMSVML